MDILYQDNHLLVVVKPPNMPVQADESGDLDLLTALKAYIKEAYHKPGAVYLGLVHRLDRPAMQVHIFPDDLRDDAGLPGFYAWRHRPALQNHLRI